MLVELLIALASLPSTAAPPLWPKGVVLPAGQPVDEDYRRQFDLCDQKRGFRGLQPKHRCHDDPNAATALRRLPEGSIAFTSKLAVDLDGSPFACSPRRGRTDQCPTSLMLPDGKGGEVPVDSDVIPYVVIPEAGPPAVRGEFARLTGVQVGDFGVVIANGRVVPVIVADTGPYAKLGEGSLALHRALGRELCAERGGDHVCRRMVPSIESISGDVVTILFPHTARPGLTPATIGPAVEQEGSRLWRQAARRMRIPAMPTRRP